MKKIKPLRARLKDRLDELWKLAIRARYPRCVMCGSESILQGHHCIVPAARGDGIKWLPNNGVTLCRNCHLFKYHGRLGGQGDKAWMERYVNIINELISADAQQEIIDISHRVNKISTFDMMEMIEQFEKGEIR